LSESSSSEEETGMQLRPVELMWARVKRAHEDSDTALLYDLLYAGEFVVRLTTAAVLSAIEEDRDRHRYRLLHTLVRADGIGEWSRALDDALIGPASHHLLSAAKDDSRIFTERLGAGSWQFEAVSRLLEVQRAIDPDCPGTPSKVSLRSWFTTFAEIRNKTRGHGAPTPALCSRISPSLEESIRILCGQNPLFRRPWAYLHRNLSGKYRVIPLGGDSGAFARLKAAPAAALAPYPNGLYIHFDDAKRVELVHTTADVSDFFFPNGAFKGRQFELHSPITDDRLDGDASPYLATAVELPASETHGIGQLEVVGNVWSNLPSEPPGYVKRAEFENEIARVLTNDRHPIATLVGRGGIGKTSLALKILHEIALGSRFEAIVWFSARDIDLLPEGPKTVRPQVLTQKDISSEFVTLMGLESEIRPGRSPLEDSKTTAEYVRRYIEQVPDGDLSRAAWERLSHLYRRTGDIVGACGAFVRAFDGRDGTVAQISNMANWVNTSHASVAGMDAVDKRAVFGALAGLMERRIGEASATDLSRLAWLHLHAGDMERARHVAQIGLAKEPGNRHCEGLIERLIDQ
jgi:hypothetical protein